MAAPSSKETFKRSYLLAFSKTLVGKRVQRKLYVVTLHDWILLEKMHSFM